VGRRVAAAGAAPSGVSLALHCGMGARVEYGVSDRREGEERVTHYDVRQSGRVVSTRFATSAREAAMDYVRSLGCSRDEITSLGADAVSWRGAVYRAAVSEAPPPARRRV